MRRRRRQSGHRVRYQCASMSPIEPPIRINSASFQAEVLPATTSEARVRNNACQSCTARRLTTRELARLSRLTSTESLIDMNSRRLIFEFWTV